MAISSAWFVAALVNWLQIELTTGLGLPPSSLASRCWCSLFMLKLELKIAVTKFLLFGTNVAKGMHGAFLYTLMAYHNILISSYARNLSEPRVRSI